MLFGGRRCLRCLAKCLLRGSNFITLCLNSCNCEKADPKKVIELVKSVFIESPEEAVEVVLAYYSARNGRKLGSCCLNR